MNKTLRVGNITMMKIMNAFMDFGYTVSYPIGDGCAYDFVVDIDDKIYRVQAKTGKLKNGSIVFSTKSNCGRWYKKEQRKNYYGRADVFGVYCYETKKCFIILVNNCGTSATQLRVDLVKHNQTKRIRFAENYELNRNNIKRILTKTPVIVSSILTRHPRLEKE